MNKEVLHGDVVVIGGGPAGALAALLFARQGRRVFLLEARPAGCVVRDARALALSAAGQQVLAQAGAWPDALSSTAIDTVHVSQQGCWGRTVIHAADAGLPHLGYVVDYSALTALLDAQLAVAGVEVLWGCRVESLHPLTAYVTVHYQDGARGGAVTARLAVLAEGGGLVDQLPGMVRNEYDYQQCAVLAQVQFTYPHGGVAYERFSREGPLALLPRGDGCMLVWTRSTAEAEKLRSASPAAMMAMLQQAFGHRLGAVRSVGDVAVFPLCLRQVNRVAGTRVVLIGNAAQTLHPVAAQGLNLGIRDVVSLARLTHGAADPGGALLLARYAQERKPDTCAVIGFTHGLIRLFDSHDPLIGAVRALGMNVLDSLPPLRKHFARRLVFGVGAR